MGVKLKESKEKIKNNTNIRVKLEVNDDHDKHH